jgi:hypothetical protein
MLPLHQAPILARTKGFEPSWSALTTQWLVRLANVPVKMVRALGFDYSTRRAATLSRRGDHEVVALPRRAEGLSFGPLPLGSARIAIVVPQVGFEPTRSAF